MAGPEDLEGTEIGRAVLPRHRQGGRKHVYHGTWRPLPARWSWRGWWTWRPGHQYEARRRRRWGALYTELWLRPEDTTCSCQQKEQWYAAIKKLTGLDIARAMGEGAETTEIHRLIRDARKQLRHRFRSSTKSGLLVSHNEDYGFAKNLVA